VGQDGISGQKGMNSNLQLRVTVLVFLTLLVLSSVFYISGVRDEARFAVEAAGCFAVVLTVMTALYGDSLLDLVRPHRFTIEVPEVKGSLADRHVLYGKEEKCFSCYLRVRNAQSDRAVKKCRVWLTRILKVSPKGEPEDLFLFAVPRLMSWAPADYSPDERSFCGWQIFDFGLFFPESAKFEVAVDKRQSGSFTRLLSAPNVQRYVFRIEVDGLIRAFEHEVDVRIVDCATTAEWPHGKRVEIKVVSPGE
jgi:hypothetical protein